MRIDWAEGEKEMENSKFEVGTIMKGKSIILHATVAILTGIASIYCLTKGDISFCIFEMFLCVGNLIYFALDLIKPKKEKEMMS